ncbi:MAG: 1-acyl-sn-glycerol-3-phosphate acyltransferase [Clostridia bacterium]|nr:1-acyl-sn-glycerol-3-phosphate acyltransferase [Clostridia bacterium]
MTLKEFKMDNGEPAAPPVRPVVPVFYACDDRFVKYTIVSLESMKQHASRDFEYHVCVLHTDISERMQTVLNKLSDDNFIISFCDVSEYILSIAEKLPLRDYYSKTTYFRMFIAEMFPEYDKAIYIDSDTIVQGDISELYFTDIGDSYVGACHEQVMIQFDVYGTYVEKALGISRYNFFNAGILLINCEEFRMHFILDAFIHYLHMYNFVVTQDEDYLNVICKDHVCWLDQRWNSQVLENIPFPIEEAKIIHYCLFSKPWHYRDCKHGDIFWHYAAQTEVYDELRANLAAYSPEQRERDRTGSENLQKLAKSETEKEDNFLNMLNSEHRSADRVAIVKKIEEFERIGNYFEDVENDPPSRVLMPDEIEYYRSSIIQKTKTKFAFMIARRFINRKIEDRQFIMKEIRGIENFRNLNTGAVITCNHFNALDSFAIQLTYEAANQPKRTFYRVIREGNYTSFPGFYGFLMRNCHTLPLSSNKDTLKKFVKSTDQILQDGHFVLIYPEQSMWWNYRKPRPFKRGAFTFAARNNVPLLPCFITMQDSDNYDDDGFRVQEYTVHVCPPLYPDNTKSEKENIRCLMAQNFAAWKEIYEREYGLPLSYTTETGTVEPDGVKPFVKEKEL